MMHVQNFDLVPTHLIKYLVRITDERNATNAWPLIDLMGAVRPFADARQNSAKPFFERSINSWIVGRNITQNFMSVKITFMPDGAWQ